MAKTVLLTGISGFIAKRIALNLLDQGYHVRGTLRGLKRFEALRAVFKYHPRRDRISLVSLDLTSDAGWDRAMDGIDAVIHTASPFPMSAAKDPYAVIEPALQGTKRVLRAAQKAKIKRIVVTSSTAAILHCDRPEGHRYGPEDWTDIDHPTATPYVRAKTLAEQAAWQFADQHPEIQMTSINPGLVCGTPADGQYGTSLKIIERLLSGKDRVVPNIGLPIVDVADVAALHVQALSTPASIGKRFLAADTYWMLPTVAEILKASFPKRDIPTRLAPPVLLRLFGMWNPAIREILPQIDRHLLIDNTDTRDTFRRPFISAVDAVNASATYIAKLQT